jgi:hypothetical protein
MAKSDFAKQLRELGYDVNDAGDNVDLAYEVPLGRFVGETIRLGFVVPGDFPDTPPSGPHIKPHIMPNSGGGGSHPTGGINPSSQFGGDWQYWSRPFPNWSKTERNVRTYMAFIRRLFDFE